MRPAECRFRVIEGRKAGMGAARLTPLFGSYLLHFSAGDLVLGEDKQLSTLAPGVSRSRFRACRHNF
jgi:hypothetical protein